MCTKLLQSCLTLRPYGVYSPPAGSSVHEILQARLLDWVAEYLSRGSSQPRDRTHVFSTAGRFLTVGPLGKPQFPWSKKGICFVRSSWFFSLISLEISEKFYQDEHWFCTWIEVSVQFSSVAQSCPTFCDSMNRSMPGLPVHHQLLEFTQTHVHWVSDAIQPSHPLSSPSPLAPNPSQNQSLFQWVNSSHEVAKVLEFQL